MAAGPKCGHTILNEKCKDCMALKKQWRKKLEKDEFEDQESPKGNWYYPDQRTIAFENREQILDFFLALDSYLTNNQDIPAKHRKVLELFSAGVHIDGPKGISKRLKIPVKTCKNWIKIYRDFINK